MENEEIKTIDNCEKNVSSNSSKIVKKFVPLSESNPELAKEWDYEKNGELTPNDVSLMSGKKVFWKCPVCGGSWEAPVSSCSRSPGNGHGCPYCYGRKALVGYNDLKTVNPRLASEWDYEKNGELLPTMVTSGSKKKVWWKCRHGHEWMATVDNRSRGSGCPHCKNYKRVSLSEKSVLYYLRKCNKFKEVLENYHGIIGKYEIDIYIPEISTGIEYDGAFWHKNVKRDIIKDELCYKNGVNLIRVRESECPHYESSSKKFYLTSFSHSCLSDCIKNLLSYLGIFDVDVNVGRDYADILSLIDFEFLENSLAFTNSKLVQEWDFELNGKLVPENVLQHSNLVVWWKCPVCGGRWKAPVSSRSAGCGCPYCSGRKVLAGFNDLKTVHPELLSEWDYEKNDIKPDEITCGSRKKVYWKCLKCGHIWKAAVADRHYGSGCPSCAAKKRGSKKVLQFDLKGNFLKEFYSITNAGISIGVSRGAIYRVVSGKRKTAGGFIWKYAKDYYKQQESDKIET